MRADAPLATVIIPYNLYNIYTNLIIFSRFTKNSLLFTRQGGFLWICANRGAAAREDFPASAGKVGEGGGE